MWAIPHMAILAKLSSDDVLDTAYGWLCKGRRVSPADADVWSFRQGSRLAPIPKGSTATTECDKQDFGSMIRQQNTP